MNLKPIPIKPGPGQESVWDYPRPPRVERITKHLQVFFNGRPVADTVNGWRVLETSQAPAYYVPVADVDMACLFPAGHNSWCEWKGQASYFTVQVGQRTALNSAWSYHHPTPAYLAIKNHLSFYAQWMDRCLVDGEVVTAPAGTFYGGWITKNVVGPFKGGPNTIGW